MPSPDLHRLIVTSETYRTQPGPISQEDSNLARDVDNRWLWHFPSRRAEAEVVRDSVLAVAGELDVHVGGQVLDSVQDAASRRRSIYFRPQPKGRPLTSGAALSRR